jgi:hypothetical protein
MKTKMLFLATVFMISGIFAASAQATIEWNYDSPLTVYETVTDLGMGYNKYEYSFTNTDTSPIWRFGVFTTFPTTGQSTFSGYGAWLGPYSISVNDTYPEYNGKNLDSEIIGFTVSDYEVGRVGIAGPAIQVGETAYGFSFIGEYDFRSTNRYYFYETIESGYTQTNGTGNVAAVGMTVPEPCTILLLTCGCVILRKRFRA